MIRTNFCQYGLEMLQDREIVTIKNEFISVHMFEMSIRRCNESSTAWHISLLQSGTALYRDCDTLAAQASCPMMSTVQVACLVHQSLSNHAPAYLADNAVNLISTTGCLHVPVVIQ